MAEKGEETELTPILQDAENSTVTINVENPNEQKEREGNLTSIPKKPSFKDKILPKVKKPNATEQHVTLSEISERPPKLEKSSSVQPKPASAASEIPQQNLQKSVSVPENTVIGTSANDFQHLEENGDISSADFDDEKDIDEVIKYVINRLKPSKSTNCINKKDTVQIVVKTYLNILSTNENLREAELRNKEENLLHVVCRSENEKVTKQIVDFFAKHKRLHNIDNKKVEALHIAAKNRNKLALELLLENIKPSSRNRRCHGGGETALVALIKGIGENDSYLKKYKEDFNEFKSSTHDGLVSYLNHNLPAECLRCNIEGSMDLSKNDKWKDHQNMLDCLDLLIKNELDINKLDFEEKSTIYWAADLGYGHIIKAIFENEMKPKVDIYTRYSDNKSPYKLITNAKLYPEYKLNNSTYQMPLLEKLFQFLRLDNTDDFIDTCNENEDELKKIVNVGNESYTLLQYAYKYYGKSEISVIETLLEHGANPTRTISQNDSQPLQEAFNDNNHDVLRLMCKDDWEIWKHILHRPIYDLCASVKVDAFSVKLKSIEIILESNNYRGINESYSNENQCTPLSYAVHNPDVAALLLDHGATLTFKKPDGRIDFSIANQLDEATLGKHFNRCIKHVINKKTKVGQNANDKGSEKCLTHKMENGEAPLEKELDTSITHKAEYNDEPTNGKDFEKDTTEFEEYAEFNFKSLLPPSSSSKDTGKQGDKDLCKEMDVVQFISKSDNLKGLLKHPLISSFLFMKWHLVRWFFFLNVFIFLGFNVSLYFYIFHHFTDDAHLWWYILIVFVCMLTLKELIEISILRINYFFAENESGKRTIWQVDMENVFETSLIVLAWIIILIEDVRTWVDIDEEVLKLIYVITVLLTSMALLLELEQMPFVNHKVAMIKKVASDLTRTFVLFVIFFIPFALSFTVMYKKKPTAAEGKTDGAEEEKISDNFFNSIFLSLFKTIVMMTGEYDMADTIDFDKYPVASAILFLMFVFFVAIICFNLLIGLAVSDTQAIINDAEVLSMIARTEHICYVQSLLEKFNKIKESSLIKKICGTKNPSIIKVEYYNSGKILYDEKENNCFSYWGINTICEFFGSNILYFDELGDKIAEETKTIIERQEQEEKRNKTMEVITTALTPTDDDE